MKYASTHMIGGSEVVLVTLPLSLVPSFDPVNPPQLNTYGVADDVEVGWVKQLDGSFMPPVITLAESQMAAVIRINAAFEAAAAALTAGYPKTETLTWPDQQAEVVAWQANNAAATPYLDALATARGIPRETYIAKTAAKVALFKAASAALVGKRQKLADQIQAATTAEEAGAVQWS